MKRILPENQERFFGGEEAAKKYAAASERMGFKYISFLEHIEKIKPEGTILEIGAGSGVAAVKIVRKFTDVSVICVEKFGEMISAGENFYPEEVGAGKIKFVKGDASDLSKLNEAGRFDFIYSAYSFHFWLKPVTAICGIMEMLNEKGVFFIHDLRRINLICGIPGKSGFIDSMSSSYTLKEAEAILQGIPGIIYEINKDFPFMLSIKISKKE